MRRLQKNRLHPLASLMVGVLLLQACSSKDPCPGFENRPALEATLISKAKSNMISDLLRDDLIKDKSDITFFSDCCGVYFEETNFFKHIFQGQEHSYAVSVVHHSYGKSGSINTYTNTSLFGRCGGYVGDITQNTTEPASYPEDLYRKYKRRINVQKLDQRETKK